MTVAVLEPAMFDAVRLTVKPGVVLAVTYKYVGSWSDDAPDPSPKFHDQIGSQPGTMFVDRFVNRNVVPGFAAFL